MAKFLLAVLLLMTTAAGIGCKTNPGSREFIPGKGWVPVK